MFETIFYFYFFDPCDWFCGPGSHMLSWYSVIINVA